MKLLPIFIAFLIVACNQPELAENKTIERIQTHRIQKDLSFKNSDQSPLPDDQKKGFGGLRYFPVDLKYRHQVSLQNHTRQDTFKITTSSGVLRDAVKYGYFEFTVAGETHSLQVYKILDIQDKYPNYLFVPFLDKTTGRQSYGGGRYLDLQENESGVYELDFNFAYNPSCAYGKGGYNCPIPPEENRLEVAIEAGEMAYLH